MKKAFLLLLFSSVLVRAISVEASPTAARNKGYFQLKVYHFSTTMQEVAIDSFLQYQYIPFLHGSGLRNIGVFKPIANDTAADKRIFVFIPFKSLRQWEKLTENSIKTIVSGEGAYSNASYDRPAYNRFEHILLKAFPLMDPVAASKITTPIHQRVYELRSYEGASEKLFRSKVKMFNEGGEIALFKRLGFNAVFYSEVVAGARMPNLMYMTSFENMASREEHWKTFVNDPEWKKLAALPEYQHTVSHIDITFLRPTVYSEL